MSLPDLSDRSQIALFLDFDGTLAAIAERPDAVRIEMATRQTLAQLNVHLDGAVAIVTGRDIGTIDEFLSPLRLPTAGVHGVTRRDASGRTWSAPVDARLEAAVTSAVDQLLKDNPGLMLERKQGAVTLHYRACPALEPVCIAAMERAVEGLDQIEVKRGKMVVEAKAIGGNKGGAIADFLAEPPFAGRRPVFAGDDVTDEDGFRLVNQREGWSIKVGAGESCARYRVESVAAFLAWLGALADRLEGVARA